MHIDLTSWIVINSTVLSRKNLYYGVIQKSKTFENYHVVNLWYAHVCVCTRGLLCANVRKFYVAEYLNNPYAIILQYFFLVLVWKILRNFDIVHASKVQL